jgi:hypothetical protein
MILNFADLVMKNKMLIQQFVSCKEQEVNIPKIVISIHVLIVILGQHPRRYNSLSISEIAALLLDDIKITNRDEQGRRSGGDLLGMDELHSAKLCYVETTFFTARMAWLEY